MSVPCISTSLTYSRDKTRATDAWRGIQPGCGQDPPHRQSPDPVAQPGKLAVPAPGSPGWFPRQPDCQRSQPGWEGGSDRAPGRPVTPVGAESSSIQSDLVVWGLLRRPSLGLWRSDWLRSWAGASTSSRLPERRPVGVRRVPVPARGDHGRGPLVPPLRTVLPGRRGVASRARRRGRSRDGLPVGAAVHAVVRRRRPAVPARAGDRWFVDETYVKVPAGGGTCTGRSTSTARSSTCCCPSSGTPPQPADSSSGPWLTGRRRSR